MRIIFIVDSRGQCELANATWHHMVGLERRLQAVELQADATELAARMLAEDPNNPNVAARKARDILAILEG